MADLTIQIHRISELEEKCRNALQYNSVFSQINSKKGAHARICALLDFIGDSESALLSIVLAEQRKNLDPYFLGYGILQIMYSRQLALKAVMKTLDMTIPKQFGKSALTEARDCVIGHPITSDKAAHVIVRNTLNEDGFEYWSYYGSESRPGNFVKYDALMTEHLDAMEVGMEMLYRHISEFENERRRQMRDDPLAPTLRGVSYLAQQICAALIVEKYGHAFNASAAGLLSALDRFRAGLVKRYGDEDAAYKVDHVMEGVRALQSLHPAEDVREQNKYRIVADGVESNVERLVALAADIDEQEASDLS